MSTIVDMEHLPPASSVTLSWVEYSEAVGPERYTSEDAITAILVEETRGRKMDDGPGLLDQ